MVNKKLKIVGVFLVGFFILFGVFLGINHVISLQDREVVQEYYADPYKVDISGLPELGSLPVDNSNDGVDWEKVVLPHPCVDGENTKTYTMVSRGTSDNVLIYFQGGGCGTDYLTCKIMTVTLNPKFKDTKTETKGIFNRTKKQNPFKNWTYVYIPYGTGDVHSGNRVMKYTDFPNMEMTVYHVGYLNGTVALRWIENQKSFEKVVVGGSSAGGYGTVMHFNSARNIFDKPITVINDAGPGLSSEKDPHFTHKITAKCWGYENNLPAGALNYVKGDEPIYYLGYTLDKYENSLYAFYEDQGDLIIGPVFLKYTPRKFGKVLIDTTSDLKESYPQNCFRFFPKGFDHTALGRERFYSLEIKGVHLYEWVDKLINRQPVDLIEN